MTDTLGAVFTGTPAVQGPIQAGAAALPSATTGLFGTGGQFGLAQTFQTTSALARGVGAFTSIQAGRAEATQFEIQAGSQDLQANGVKLSAAEKSNILKKQLLRDLGAATASAAARGLDVGGGTPRQIVEESISTVQTDLAKIRAGADIEALSARTSAAQSRQAGAAARVAGNLRAVKSIVGFGLSRVL